MTDATDNEEVEDEPMTAADYDDLEMDLRRREALED